MDRVDRSQREQVDEEYLDRLTALLPEWRQINKDPRWLRWLRDKNPDGIARQVVLDQHSAARNAELTIAVFKAYLQDAGALPKPAPKMADMPFPLTALGYRQWKTAISKTGFVWRSNPDLTKQINARFDAAIANGTLT